MSEAHRIYVGGEWRETVSGRTYEKRNPWQPEVVTGTYAAASGADAALVSYTRAKAEALRLRGDVGIGSRAERVVVITGGLVLAPWGVLPWAIALLAATAWFTVLQRVLHVRRELRARAS